MKRYLPFFGFLVLIGLFGWGIWWNSHHDMTAVPSPLINKPAPAFNLTKLYAPSEHVSKAMLLGKPYLINVFASWCVACLEEHPVWMAHAKDLGVPLVGYDYKDPPQDAKAWLAKHGNPFSIIITDRSGRTAINFGVYGVPETYLIDAKGFIRWKNIGPVTPKIIRTKLIPMLRAVGAHPDEEN